MKIDLHVYFHPSADDAIARILEELNCLERILMGALTDLQTAVAGNTTVVDSAVALLEGIKAKLDEAIANGDPAALTALSSALGADTTKLADAVVKNTPAA